MVTTPRSRVDPRQQLIREALTPEPTKVAPTIRETIVTTPGETRELYWNPDTASFQSTKPNNPFREELRRREAEKDAQIAEINASIAANTKREQELRAAGDTAGADRLQDLRRSLEQNRSNAEERVDSYRDSIKDEIKDWDDAQRQRITYEEERRRERLDQDALRRAAAERAFEERALEAGLTRSEFQSLTPTAREALRRQLDRGTTIRGTTSVSREPINLDRLARETGDAAALFRRVKEEPDSENRPLTFTRTPMAVSVRSPLENTEGLRTGVYTTRSGKQLLVQEGKRAETAGELFDILKDSPFQRVFIPGARKLPVTLTTPTQEISFSEQAGAFVKSVREKDFFERTLQQFPKVEAAFLGLERVERSTSETLGLSGPTMTPEQIRKTLLPLPGELRGEKRDAFTVVKASSDSLVFLGEKIASIGTNIVSTQPPAETITGPFGGEITRPSLLPTKRKFGEGLQFTGGFIEGAGRQVTEYPVSTTVISLASFGFGAFARPTARALETSLSGGRIGRTAIRTGRAIGKTGAVALGTGAAAGVGIELARTKDIQEAGEVFGRIGTQVGAFGVGLRAARPIEKRLLSEVRGRVAGTVQRELSTAQVEGVVETIGDTAIAERTATQQLSIGGRRFTVRLVSNEAGAGLGTEGLIPYQSGQAAEVLEAIVGRRAGFVGGGETRFLISEEGKNIASGTARTGVASVKVDGTEQFVRTVTSPQGRASEFGLLRPQVRTAEPVTLIFPTGERVPLTRISDVGTGVTFTAAEGRTILKGVSTAGRGFSGEAIRPARTTPSFSFGEEGELTSFRFRSPSRQRVSRVGFVTGEESAQVTFRPGESVVAPVFAERFGQTTEISSAEIESIARSLGLRQKELFPGLSSVEGSPVLDTPRLVPPTQETVLGTTTLQTGRLPVLQASEVIAFEIVPETTSRTRPLIRPNLKLSPGIETVVTPRTVQFTRPNTSSLISEENAIRPAIRSLGAQQPRISSREVLEPKISTRLQTRLEPRIESRLAQRQAVRQAQRLVQRQVVRQTPRITTGFTEIIPRTPPPKIPGLELPSRAGIATFTPFVRRRGVFKPVSSRPLSRRAATFLGATAAATTSAATFEIRPSGFASPEDVEELKISNTQYERLLKRFRKPIRRGVPQTSSPRFIERSRFRIDTPRELQEITFEGIRASRNRRNRL